MAGDVILMGLVMLLVAAGSAAAGYSIGMKNRFDDMMEEMWQAYEERLQERISALTGEEQVEKWKEEGEADA